MATFAATLADRVAILASGRLLQVDAPQAIYERPATAFVHSFLGGSACLPGVVDGDQLRFAQWTTTAPQDAPQGAVQVCLRTGEIALSNRDDGLPATCTAVLPRGAIVRVETRTPEGQEIDVERPAGALPDGLSVGASVRLKPERLHVYPTD